MGLYVMSRSVTEMGIGGRMENGSGDSCLLMVDEEEKTENLMNVGYRRGYSSSSDSSIGENSDEGVENEIDHGEEDEVQSCYNKEGNGFFHSLQDVGESLPDKKGISDFYPGKSKSYTSLADASACSSITEISKPSNVYEKRRKNSLAKKLVVDKNYSSQLKSSGGVLKKSKLSTTRQCTLALAVAMTNSPKNSDMIQHQDPTPYSRLSPHYSQIRHSKFNSSCSTSFADLEQRASLETSAPL